MPEDIAAKVCQAPELFNYLSNTHFDREIQGSGKARSITKGSERGIKKLNTHKRLEHEVYTQEDPKLKNWLVGVLSRIITSVLDKTFTAERMRTDRDLPNIRSGWRFVCRWRRRRWSSRPPSCQTGPDASWTRSRTSASDDNRCWKSGRAKCQTQDSINRNFFSKVVKTKNCPKVKNARSICLICDQSYLSFLM